MSFLSKLFDSNEAQLKKIYPIVEKINSLEEKYAAFSNEQIREQTQKWKTELRGLEPEEQQKRLEELLPDAFAVVREGAKRTLKLRHYDVQLISGIVLHQGKISEQKTGEGKTLTATLPLYLNALAGKGAHLVTPNDYLSRHGAGWMGVVYDFLGLKVGAIIQEKAYVYDPTHENHSFDDHYSLHLKEVNRRDAYDCDITYGTNHEFGFDYLRDNMARTLDQVVQVNPVGDFGAHNFAIVDEVDSILIDVARTPLIISTQAQQATERYNDASRIVKQLIKDTDYEVDEKFRNATLTDLGVRRVENFLGVGNLYEQDFEMVHLIEQSLIANALYEKDKDYVVKEGKIVIVDQFTGRLLPSNRYSHGLHQAIEAKEGVEIQQESRSLAEISYQNYFRMYSKLAGMTGTAVTEAEEFFKIYKLDVVVIPTNKPIARKDGNDVVYKSVAGKFRAVAEDIAERHKKGQPVLVGTTSVEKSQLLHDLLKRKKIPHEILNAKNHSREALIIAQAGRKGAVTVSTNMAGRGVDIILGGDPHTPEEQEEVKELGGLYVIGTERHESRRIDNQLRGRSGRQGDPGESRFYVSLQDDLMRIFGGEQAENLMSRIGLDENTPLESGIVSKAIENAQKKVEGFNFDRRKQLVDMDDVINTHREVVYKLRNRILFANEDITSFENWFIRKLSDYSDLNFDAVLKKFKDQLGNKWTGLVQQVALPVVDLMWMDHLTDMERVKEGIGLRGYAQRDPIVEYKREGHERFEILVGQIYIAIGERLSKIEGIEVAQSPSVKRNEMEFKRGELESGVSEEGQAVNASSANSRAGFKVEQVKSNVEKVGRNDPCPCGSGKKYKHCHGK